MLKKQNWECSIQSHRSSECQFDIDHISDTDIVTFFQESVNSNAILIQLVENQFEAPDYCSSNEQMFTDEFNFIVQSSI